MSFWSKIFLDKNQKNWNELLHKPEIPQSLKEVINKFFLPDDIDCALFFANDMARRMYDSGQDYFTLEAMSKMNGISNNRAPTPTFRGQFLDLNYLMNKPQACHDWFVCAYPDVTKWISDNAADFINRFDERYLIDTNGKATFLFYKAAIKEFKKNHSLECQYKG